METEKRSSKKKMRRQMEKVKRKCKGKRREGKAT